MTSNTVAFCLAQVRCNIEMAASSSLAAISMQPEPARRWLNRCEVYKLLAENYLEKAQAIRFKDIKIWPELCSNQTILINLLRDVLTF